MPRRDHGYGFGGPRERDGEAGLDDFNARSLQARTGRMNRPDPLFAGAMGDPQGWNRYAYVQNNPLVFTDPNRDDSDLHIRCGDERNVDAVDPHWSCSVQDDRR